MNTELLSRALRHQADEYVPGEGTLPGVLQRSRQRRARRRLAAAGGVAATVGGVAAFVSSGMFASHPVTGPAATDAPLTVAVLNNAPIAARSWAAQTSLGTRLFVWGGQTASLPENATPDSASAFLDDGALYDPARNAWTVTPTSELSPRSHAVAIWTGSEVLVAGGRDERHTVASAALFNPATNRWHSLPDSPNCPLFGEVAGGTVVTLGRCNAEGSDTSLFDISSRTWTSGVESPLGIPQQLVPIEETLYAVDEDGDIAAWTNGRWSTVPSISSSAEEPPLLGAVDGQLTAVLRTSTSTGDHGDVYVLNQSHWDHVSTLGVAPSSTSPLPASVASGMIWASDVGICRWDGQQSDCVTGSDSSTLPASETAFVAAEGRIYLWGGEVVPAGGGMAHPTSGGIEIFMHP